MDVTTRTLRNWGAEGLIPRPAEIKGRRFWHPDVFYSWLDATLKGLERWDVRAVAPFKPITRHAAAAVLGVSIRTVEIWSDSGVMPKPVSIKGRRYWHPEIFYRWLEARLKGSHLSERLPRTPPPAGTRQPDAAPQPAEQAAASAPKRAPRSSSKAGSVSVARAQARSAARLAQLNG